MDYNDKYIELFYMIKNRKYDNFLESLSEIDEKTDFIFDINVRDDQHNYLITYAVTLNQINIVDALIKKGARIDITNKNDESILIQTIEYSYFEILELLLQTNKKSIGVSIVDIKDKLLRIPLHYAIEIKNIKAIKLLLKYGSNVNVSEGNGYSSLHLAVRSRSFEICEIIIPFVSNINSRYNTGESSLHIACNLQLTEIVALLIKYNADPNINDYDHEITPLHYAVYVNNRDIINMLLKAGANPNSQDITGNTPLHYCVLENNFEAFVLITKSTYTRNIINFNAWNINGEIPLHLALKHSNENIEDYLSVIIEKSNLSVQDSDGNSCLYYLIIDDIWKSYEDQLIKKRLDIFSVNKLGKMPIDVINKEDYNYFINILAKSYINRLKSVNNLWYDEWENICAKTFSDVTEKEIEILGKNINNDNMCKKCIEIAKLKITTLINKVKSKKLLLCREKSFPIKKSYTCIDVKEGSKVLYCTFTGSTLDILVGLIYLLQTHKNACSTLRKNFTTNNELCKFYRSLGVIMNSKCEFLNFEIVWVHQRLYLMEGFFNNFKECLNGKSQFIIIPVGIEMKDGSHAGYLIYDKQLNEIERFEPHGSTTPPGLYYNPNLLDDILESRFKSVDENMTYIRPGDYIPKIGFQLFDSKERNNKKIGDPLGFCALWCIWYTDMRITYKHIPRKKLVSMLINNIKSKNVSFKNMVRNYGQHIIKIRDDILAKSKMDINDWQNDQYTDTQINSVLKELVIKIESY